MALYPLGNRWGNNSCSRRCRRGADGAGVSVSAVTWEGDIASAGAAGGAGGVVMAGSRIGPAATVGLEVGAAVTGGPGFCWTS